MDMLISSMQSFQMVYIYHKIAVYSVIRYDYNLTKKLILSSLQTTLWLKKEEKKRKRIRGMTESERQHPFFREHLNSVVTMSTSTSDPRLKKLSTISYKETVLQLFNRPFPLTFTCQKCWSPISELWAWKCYKGNIFLNQWNNHLHKSIQRYLNRIDFPLVCHLNSKGTSTCDFVLDL